ncbi:MAG TPA: aldehyde:ferredoxin oxidoreductase [Acidilobales archaeon]|nr:aldehyde:ferredoxin oxidoreductase [Acidilobales archaeon]
MSYIRYLSKVLYIDLTRKTFWVESREDLFSEWLGGIGVATQLYKEEIPSKADPLGPENAIIFAVGPFTMAYPLGSKTVAVFKSPLNGYFAESHAGGRSAAAIRLAGYGAIVIKGASERPLYLVIDGNKVLFRDAGTLWGMRSTETVGRVLRDATSGAGVRTIMRIGKAGERLVRYATVITETYRHFGRLGLGAVFGSKKLKALVIIGKGGFKVPNPKEYREVFKEIYETATKSPVMRKYHDLGTAANVIPLSKIGALPTRNFSSGNFEHAEEISGEKLAEHVLARRVACSGCPIACIHVAALREPYGDEPYFYKTTFISYDYELLYSLGSNLGISSREGLLKLIYAVEEEGLDAISTGVILAWITEAFKKGLISEKEVLAKPDWGKYEEYIKIVHNIIKQPNEFYKVAALGVHELGKKYGGEEFAIEFNKVEPAGYHTGPLFIASLIIGARHSHLDSGAYSMDQKLLKAGKPVPEVKEGFKMIYEEESWRQVLNSLVICLFARGLYKPEVVLKALRGLGYRFRSVDELKELGKRIYLKKHLIKLSEGYDPLKVKVPKRLLEVKTALGPVNGEYVRGIVKEYVTTVREESKKELL